MVFTRLGHQFRNSNPNVYKKGLAFLALVSALSTGCSGVAGSPPVVGSSPKTGTVKTEPPPKVIALAADKVWLLESGGGGRFDASGLVITTKRELLTVNDRNSDIYKIELSDGPVAKLVKTDIFTPAQLSGAAEKPLARYDSEGLARDRDGNVYLCEESQRAVFRWDRRTRKVTRLRMDWTPVTNYFSRDLNASFEGIAVGDQQIFIANERQEPRIIVVDAKTLAVEDNFAVYSSGFAFGGPHYSDLAWHNGSLFVLDRNHRAILQVNPKSKEVLAEYSYAKMELDPEFAYHSDYPTGAMEGLAVDDQYFYLVTDNNGKDRFKYPGDKRPTLFRCERPDGIKKKPEPHHHSKPPR